MRADESKSKIYTQEVGKLRIYSTTLRKEYHDKIINWVDQVLLPDGTTGEALTFVLPTRGCKYATASHGGCTMCTLPTDNPLAPTMELLNSLPKRALEIFNKKGGKERFGAVKFYTSGSFLDRWELPFEIQRNVITAFVDIVQEITIETRCEYVTKKNLDNITSVMDPRKLTVAIGQETTNDEINRRSINKGHTFMQFKRAVEKLQEYNIRVKGYILLKPIFISELTALKDAIQTGKDMIAMGIDSISINPSYIGKATLMEKLFKGEEYSPPWLWTVYFATLKIKEMAGDITVISDPVAAGSDRGPSNCGVCDKGFKRVLKEFSSTQKIDLLFDDELMCSCQEVYRSAINTEHVSNGFGVNFHY